MNKLDAMIDLASIPVDITSDEEVIDYMIDLKEDYKCDPALYNWLCNGANYSQRTDHINNAINAHIQADFMSTMLDFVNEPAWYNNDLTDELEHYGVELYKDKILKLMEVLRNE